MKYLLFALLIYLAWRWLAAKKAAADHDIAPPSPSPVQSQDGAAEKIVGCAHCGIHLPVSESVQGTPGLHFCSDEHRSLHARR